MKHDTIQRATPYSKVIQQFEKEIAWLVAQHPESEHFSRYDTEQKEKQQQQRHQIISSRWGLPQG